MVVAAYSPDDTPHLQIQNRLIEALCKTLTPQTMTLSIASKPKYHERVDRYERERAKDPSDLSSSAVMPSRIADNPAEDLPEPAR